MAKTWQGMPPPIEPLWKQFLMGVLEGFAPVIAVAVFAFFIGVILALGWSVVSFIGSFQ